MSNSNPGQLTDEDIEWRFFRLWSTDFNTARHTIKVIREHDDNRTRYPLLRDVVVSYGRPFSGNRGPDGKTHRIDVSLVPDSQRQIHDELFRFRNTLFAHTDWNAYNPRMSSWSTPDAIRFGMMCRGLDYERQLNRRIDETEALVIAVEANWNARIAEIEHRVHSSIFPQSREQDV